MRAAPSTAQPGAVKRGQDVVDSRGHLEGRHQLAAMQFQAAVVAGMQWGMDDAHGKSDGGRSAS